MEEKKLKILLLEDNPDDAGLVQHVLRKNGILFTFECVDTRDEFDQAIHRFRPDVILSDHGLPGFNSNEALKMAMKIRPSTPFILVTGTVNDEYAISCIRQGADDYILKSNLSRLPTAITGAIRKRRLERMKREARHTLRIQNDALSKANQELDNFVYSVSHNLRGPLATLMGLLNVAKVEDRNQHLKPIHGMMEMSMKKLDDTLREILEYSWNARGELHFIDINWSELINGCLKKLEYLEGSADIKTDIRLDTTYPFSSDWRRIQVIFTNLLSNAIIYRDNSRKPVINIDVVTKPDSAVISIRDNGMGVREEVLKKITKMFYRGSEKSQGAGLGLYIVKEIVARLNGELRIDSTYSEGTTVELTLPNNYEGKLENATSSIAYH